MNVFPGQGKKVFISSTQSALYYIVRTPNSLNFLLKDTSHAILILSEELFLGDVVEISIRNLKVVEEKNSKFPKMVSAYGFFIRAK